MKKILIALMFVAANGGATVVGGLIPLKELNIQHGIGREAADGIYDVVQVVDIHKFQFKKADGNPWPLLSGWNTGLYHGWNINQRADHFGVTTGPIIYDVNVTPALDLPITMLGLDKAYKPSSYITVTNSVRGFVGYRPVLNGDIVHQIAYGGMFVLVGRFGLADVSKIVTGPPGL